MIDCCYLFAWLYFDNCSHIYSAGELSSSYNIILSETVSTSSKSPEIDTTDYSTKSWIEDTWQTHSKWALESDKTAYSRLLFLLVTDWLM